MKLYYAPTSPYVRKVIVLAMERGLDDRLELVPTNPFSEDSGLRAFNPISKIPTLELDDGQILIESTLICEYLDGLHNGAKLFPSDETRVDVLNRTALADGLVTAGIACRVEKEMRPAELFWQDYFDRHMKSMLGAISVLEKDADKYSAADDFDIADISLACGLGWVDFRFPDVGWRNDNPAIADWFETFSDRPSMQKTMPPEG
jgi:glutathione S-transferase